MMSVDKQEGVYAGGKAEYTGVRTFEVYSDYAKGQSGETLSQQDVPGKTFFSEFEKYVKLKKKRRVRTFWTIS